VHLSVFGNAIAGSVSVQQLCQPAPVPAPALPAPINASHRSFSTRKRQERSAWRWARLDITFIPNEMALLARCFELSFLNIFATTTAGPRLLWEAPTLKMQ
jgi:hypothetical protein